MKSPSHIKTLSAFTEQTSPHHCIFIYSSFNVDVTNSDYIALTGQMIVNVNWEG